jgi:hypothetical protein
MVALVWYGWMVVADIDVIAGVFSRDQLSTGLVAVHRAGFGPHARVLDSARGPLEGQLRKANLQVAANFAAGDTDITMILITAPGRADRAAATLTGAGARAVHRAVPAGTASVVHEAPVTIEVPLPPPATAIEP